MREKSRWSYGAATALVDLVAGVQGRDHAERQAEVSLVTLFTCTPQGGALL